MQVDGVAVFQFFRGPLVGDSAAGQVLQIHASIPFVSTAKDFNFPYQRESVSPKYREQIINYVVTLRREITNADRQASVPINPKDFGQILHPVRQKTHHVGEKNYYQVLIHCADLITDQLGLDDYIFRFLFSLENSVRLIKICTDELDIPWDWVYDSKQGKLLCELFGVGITYPNTRQSVSHYREMQDYSVTAEELASLKHCALVVANTYSESSHSLTGLYSRADELAKLLRGAFGEKAVEILKNNKRKELLRFIRQRADVLRLICFCGHFTEYGFLTADGRYLTGDELLREFGGARGTPLAAQPVVILNGCASSGASSTKISRQMNQNRELARAFLELGAGACIVTSTDVRLNYSMEFMTNLLNYLLCPGTTLGSALLRARNAMDKNKCYEWAVYHLLGDPTYVMSR